MKAKPILCLSILLLSLAATVWARETAPENKLNAWLSTDQVENQITLDKKANPLYESRLLTPLRDWRDGVAEKQGSTGASTTAPCSWV
jgi:porin